MSESQFLIHPQGGLLLPQWFCLVRKQNKKWVKIKKEPKANCLGGGKSCVLDKQTTFANDGGQWTHENSAEDVLIFSWFIYSFIWQPETMIEDVDDERERERDRLALCLPASLWNAEGANIKNKKWVRNKENKRRPRRSVHALSQGASEKLSWWITWIKFATRTPLRCCFSAEYYSVFIFLAVFPPHCWISNLLLCKSSISCLQRNRQQLWLLIQQPDLIQTLIGLSLKVAQIPS